MAPRKHAALIKQWADGAQIQYRHEPLTPVWSDIEFPSWDYAAEYRVKPAADTPAYPETNLTPDDLALAFLQIMVGTIECGMLSKESSARLVRLANLVLREAIDAGIVAPRETFNQCAADLLQAEETLRRLTETVKDCDPNNRHARDRLIAEAVQDAAYNAVATAPVGRRERHVAALDLDAIIRSVKP